MENGDFASWRNEVHEPYKRFTLSNKHGICKEIESLLDNNEGV